ncbi:uncharacterized protein LOC129002275 [Macrosteles quadrilineatus]|uniref:uncharacterized protein LOC129002275 n=1 Tax=Macrosteles quadrilineatus TaxID=74068 RepID=UPI0023E1DD41|nr:uncharacterized protein LOC129002275 [Macrosteles quadrilineatus]
MYRQILVHPDDQKYQLILWRNNSSQDLSTYQLATVTYGVNSSPYLAIRTLHQLAKDEGEAFPAAAQVLTSNTYVDDIIAGADTVEDVLELQSQIISLLSRGGFELRKWSSNAKELLQALPQEHLELPVFLEHAKEPLFSILGLQWSPVSDCFTFNIHFSDAANETPTKRRVLSLVAKIYDPCGFLAPCTMQAKCFIQLLWTTGLNWDEELSSDLTSIWQNFVTNTQSLSNIQIPRAFQFSVSSAIELHGFSDASESGYAAVLYFRCKLSSGDVTVRQILAKTRVSPLKRVTLPRLELCAAHLLAQLASYCLSMFTNKVTFSRTVLWCDSSITLTWLQTPPYRLKTYVANRVAQTQELFPSHCWRYIPSQDNPADCASRGITATQLQNHPLWWTGPSWLSQPCEDWPNRQFTPVNLDNSEETKGAELFVFTSNSNPEWELLTRFSSWTKLVRITAYIHRFVYNARRSNKLRSSLTTNELKSSTTKIIQLVQKSCFF